MLVKKEEYKLKNARFLEELATQKGIKVLSSGVLYKPLKKGKPDAPSPRYNSVVTVHYRGTLINGKEFDNSYKQRYPPAFRLNQVIKGWQIALTQMQVGEKGILYIPYQVGYGTRACGNIPAFSTLIFEVEVLGIG